MGTFRKGLGPRSALVLAAWGLLGTGGCQAEPFPIVSRERLLRLGESEIALYLHTSEPLPPGRPAFLVLHDDEDTAVDAGLTAIRERGGRLVEVKTGGDRLVGFTLHGAVWRFDPNRIFSHPGAEATLRRHNAVAPPKVMAEVVAEVRRFAEEILAAHDPAPLLVTLHNNTDGDYSAASYLPGGSFAPDAAIVHLPERADPDDFFFVTDPRLYDRLAALGFAVVLQDGACVTDDGSLSVWAGRYGIPYVNVETEHGHTARQGRMLEALSRILETGI